MVVIMVMHGLCNAAAQNRAKGRAWTDTRSNNAPMLLCEALQAVLGKQIAILIRTLRAEQGYVPFSNFEGKEGFHARQVWEGLHQIALVHKDPPRAAGRETPVRTQTPRPGRNVDA